MIQVNEYILDELRSRYDKLTLNKTELAKLLNISPRTLSNKISNGTIWIKFTKLGTSKQAHVVFPIIYVAEYLTHLYFKPNS